MGDLEIGKLFSIAVFLLYILSEIIGRARKRPGEPQPPMDDEEIIVMEEERVEPEVVRTEPASRPPWQAPPSRTPPSETPPPEVPPVRAPLPPERPRVIIAKPEVVPVATKAEIAARRAAVGSVRDAEIRARRTRRPRTEPRGTDIPLALTPQEARRAIVMMTVLGPPPGMRPDAGSPDRVI